MWLAQSAEQQKASIRSLILTWEQVGQNGSCKFVYGKTRSEMLCVIDILLPT